MEHTSCYWILSFPTTFPQDKVLCVNYITLHSTNPVTLPAVVCSLEVPKFLDAKRHKGTEILIHEPEWLIMGGQHEHHSERNEEWSLSVSATRKEARVGIHPVLSCILWLSREIKRSQIIRKKRKDTNIHSKDITFLYYLVVHAYQNSKILRLKGA